MTNKLADKLKIEVEKVLKSNYPSKYIADNVEGISRQMIDKYRNGVTPVGKMPIDTADNITQFWQNKSLRFMNKAQWENMAGRIDNADDARDFLSKNVYGWSSQESAFNNFKHTVMKSVKMSLAVKGEKTFMGGDPEDYADWLKELDVSDVAEK